MDILPTFSCLLGRTWIHSAGVVPSTLHQKLKYVMRDNMVTISGEENFFVSGPSSARYVETIEEAFEIAFQDMEIVGDAYDEPFQIKPYLSCASLMMAKVMLREGYEYGKGLGKVRQGLIFTLKIVENKNRYSLGYKPTKEDIRRLMEEKKERSLARLQGRELRVGKISICDLKRSFRTAEWINTSQLATIKK